MSLRRLMPRHSGLLAVISMILAMPAWAAPQSTWEEKPQTVPSKHSASLKLPARADLLVLDGQSAGDLELKKDQPLKLTGKRHQVVFRLSDTISVSGDRQLVTSRPFIISFHPLNGHNYEIQAPVLKNRKQLDAFNQNPEAKIRLVSDKDEETPYEFAVLRTRGMQIGRNIEVDIQKFNRGANTAAVPEFVAMMPMSAETGFTAARQDPKIYGTSATQAEEAEMGEKMLRYWFEKSSPETRTRFLEWAREQ
ncbi:MAG: YccT family protein [Endozoicomonas sp.]